MAESTTTTYPPARDDDALDIGNPSMTHMTTNMTPPPHETKSTTSPNTDVYPYLHLLRDLQSRAMMRTSTATAGPPSPSIDDRRVKCEEETTMMTSSKSKTWDLSDDARLVTALHEFTKHAMRRVTDVSNGVRDLQVSINDVGIDVSLLRTEYARIGDARFLEQSVATDDLDDDVASSCEERDAGGRNGDVVVDDHDVDEHEGNDDGDDDSSASIARLETEERSAISDGMMALRLFYDPNRRTSGGIVGVDGGDSDYHDAGGGVGEGGHVGGVTMSTMIDDDDRGEKEADGGGIGYDDDCYYYPCADDDVFNHRPLPFIIGSREFMESGCAGLG
jgi:hypothetical protein